MPLHVDRTLTASMDARRRSKVSDWFKNLKGRTHLDNHELMCMLLLFVKMNRPRRHFLKPKEFFSYLRSMFGILDDSILQRMYITLERPNDPGIGYDQWVCMVSLYCRGSLEEKIAFNWMVYDTIGTGYLTRDNVLDMVGNHLGQFATAEDLGEHADDIIRLLDVDQDKKISSNDYKTAVSEKPILLNSLGRVCPEPHVTNAFLATFTPKIGEKYQASKEQKVPMDITQFRGSIL